MRNERVRPIMEEMKKWLETEGVRYSQHSLIGKAVYYAYNRWDNMMRELVTAGQLKRVPRTDNNPHGLFITNWRNHNVNPRLYLNDIIAKMPYKQKATNEELIELLAHRWIQSHSEALMEKLRETV